MLKNSAQLPPLTGPWNRHQAMDFLNKSIIPLRLAVVGRSGWPVITSLWFIVESDIIWCATHRTAKIIQSLQFNPRCAFEVAPDQPPYRGLRGQAQVELVHDLGGAVLSRLIDRYQRTRDSDLARWLLSRSDEEIALEVTPVRMQAWDYSKRMHDNVV